jgi:hypothetical protein
VLARQVLPFAVIVAACGRQGSYTASIDVPFLVHPSDAAGGTVDLSQQIRALAGDPYGAFVSATTAALAGAAPSRITVTACSLRLDSGGPGVGALDQVFGVPFSVTFSMNHPAGVNDYSVCSTPQVSASTAQALTVDFVDFAAPDHAAALNGDFQVVVDGAAAPGFAAGGADATITVTLDVVGSGTVANI